MGEYLVERYEAGISADTLRGEARRLTQAVSTMRDEGASIDFLGLTFLPSDEGVLARFTSESKELVVGAHERASVRFERIVEAVPLDVALDESDGRGRRRGNLPNEGRRVSTVKREGSG